MYGDADGNAVDEEELVQAIHSRAYYLWEQDGRPEGKAGSFWHVAEDYCLRAREYARHCQSGGL
jgi:hypothetical protein